MTLSREDCDRVAERTDKTQKKSKPKAPHRWTEKKWSEKTIGELVASLDLVDNGESEIYTEKPEDFDRGPVPRQPIWRENAFILPMCFFPLTVQTLAYHFTGKTWNPWAAFGFYHLWFALFALSNVKRLHHYCVKYGVLDEKNRGRDIISDQKVDHLGFSILTYTVLRTAGPFLLAYNREVAPLLELGLWSLPKIMAWEIALDLFFYIYHSACHRVDSLWFVHRAHHGTKHPTAILSILADDYQEVIEVILCPTLASWVLPLTFAEGYIAIVYLLYVEMLGHSGVRAYWPHPLLTPILKPLDMELAVEDHDLHHRGGRGGQNYGKQTRIWDKLGNSVGKRLESGGF